MSKNVRHVFITIIIIFGMVFSIEDACAQRIVSLKPNVTDIVYALGVGEELVGVTKFCDVPANVVKPAVVGDYSQAYIERVVSLSPDIVIGSKENSSRRSIEELKQLGIRVELFPFTTIEDTMNSIRAIGKILNVSKKSEEVANGIKQKNESLKNKWGTYSPARTVVIWGTRPMVVAGRGSYMDELLKNVGAVNVVNVSKIKYPRIDLEELITLNPDAIIDLSMGSEENIGSKPWDSVKSLKAVQDGKIISLNAKDFRAGPNLPDALAKLGEMIHK